MIETLNFMETISKVESAKRHLVEAIKLFFEERDSLAIHTLAAAAQGTLRDIARVSGAERLSILHDHSDIAPEHKRNWINALNAPRDFFKHGENDPNGILEFHKSDNVMVLLDAVLLYWTVANESFSAANVFMGWFTTKNPEMRKALSDNTIGDYCVRNNISADDKSRFLELIDVHIFIEPA